MKIKKNELKNIFVFLEKKLKKNIFSIRQSLGRDKKIKLTKLRQCSIK